MFLELLERIIGGELMSIIGKVKTFKTKDWINYKVAN